MIKKFFHLITLGLFVTKVVPKEPDLDLSYLDMNIPSDRERFTRIIEDHAKRGSSCNITC